MPKLQKKITLWHKNLTGNANHLWLTGKTKNGMKLTEETNKIARNNFASILEHKGRPKKLVTNKKTEYDTAMVRNKNKKSG